MKPRRHFADLSPETQARIERDYRAGVLPVRLAAMYDIGADAIRLRFDPEWGARRRAGVREARHRRERGARSVKAIKRAEPIDVRRDGEQAIRFIPTDTRSLTGVIFGDPIPNDPRRART